MVAALQFDNKPPPRYKHVGVNDSKKAFMMKGAADLNSSPQPERRQYLLSTLSPHTPPQST